MDKPTTPRETFNMAKRGSPPEGYYTASMTRKKLGNISDGLLRSYIQRGLIERVVPPGRKQGFYRREAVDKLAKIIDDLPIDKKEKTETKFQQATKEDMPGCVELLIKVFGGGNTTEKRQQWIEKNPEVAYVIRSKGKVVGCAFVLPLTPEKIDVVFNDQCLGSSRSISADDIQLFSTDQDVYLYIVSLCVEAQTELAKRIRGQILVRGLIKQVIKWGSRGIRIKIITGRSDTKDGINLMKHMGFTEIESTTNNRNFIIEVERSGIPFMMQYKNALNRWQNNKEDIA